jgi:hypothetical protein
MEWTKKDIIIIVSLCLLFIIVVAGFITINSKILDIEKNSSSNMVKSGAMSCDSSKCTTGPTGHIGPQGLMGLSGIDGQMGPMGPTGVLSSSYGELYFPRPTSGSGTVAQFTSAFTNTTPQVVVTGWTVGQYNSGIKPSPSGYLVNTSGIYKITSNLSYTENDSSNYYFVIYRNGAELPDLNSAGYRTSNINFFTAVIDGIVNLNKGDVIDLRIGISKQSSSPSLSIYQGNFNLVKIA